MNFDFGLGRSERLSVAHFCQIAESLRTRPTPDPRTAAAVADALESVARQRVARARRERLGEEDPSQSVSSLRRAAQWAVTRF